MSAEHESGDVRAKVGSLVAALEQQQFTDEPIGLEPSLSELLAIEQLSDHSLSTVLRLLEEFEQRSQRQAVTADELSVLVRTIHQEAGLPETPGSFDVAIDAESGWRHVDDGIRWMPVREFVGGPFAILPGRMQQELRRHMQPRTFADQELLFAEGTQGDCLLLVTRGTVGIWSRQLNRRLGSVGPGEVAGEMALMGVPLRTADAVAEGEVDVLRLDSEDFCELCRRFPQIAHVITHVIANRLGTEQHDVFSEKTLHGYCIRQRLGRGGMAIVYDAELVEQQLRVALKMMSHRLVFDKIASEWFRREAATISGFNHPNIPRLVDCFDGFGTTFIAMEFIEGETLADLLKRGGPLSEGQALRVLSQLGQALEYAHQAGIVHRDIKPGNVMMTPRERVMLMDFGLSVPWQSPDKTALVAGTLSYMSPEQFRGEPLTPASDWFSFGCLAFELVTGRRLLTPRLASDLFDIYDDWDLAAILSQLPEDCGRIKELLPHCLSLVPSDRNGAAVRRLLAQAVPDESSLKAWN